MASVIRLSKTLAHLNSLVTCLLKTSAHSNGLVIRSLKNISLFKQLGLFSIKRLVLSVWKVQDWIVLHYLSHRFFFYANVTRVCYIKTRNGIMHGIIMFTISNSLSKETIKGTIWQHAKLLEKSCSCVLCNKVAINTRHSKDKQ